MDLDHERRLTEVEQRSKSNTRQIEELKPVVAEIHKMSTVLVEMTAEIKHTNKDVRDIKDKVEALEDRPAKRWDTLTTVIITALASGIITYILSNIF